MTGVILAALLRIPHYYVLGFLATTAQVSFGSCARFIC